MDKIHSEGNQLGWSIHSVSRSILSFGHGTVEAEQAGYNEFDELGNSQAINWGPAHVYNRPCQNQLGPPSVSGTVSFHIKRWCVLSTPFHLGHRALPDLATWIPC